MYILFFQIITSVKTWNNYKNEYYRIYFDSVASAKLTDEIH